jgi:MFS family permease
MEEVEKEHLVKLDLSIKSDDYLKNNNENENDIKIQPTPLPMREIFVLMCIVISEGFASSMVLPFIGFMVMDFGISSDNVGYYAGFVTSSFYAAQFISSFFWGYWSDLKGRRSVLLFGLFGNAISALAFGFSKWLIWAVITRSLAGLLNGNTAVAKSYITEITDETNQAKGYIYRSAGYAIGSTCGLFLGGILSRPAIQYPKIFSQNGLFGKFPYLLPCLVSVFVNLIGLITGFFFLKDTKKIKYEELEMQKINDNKENNFNNDEYNDDNNDNFFNADEIIDNSSMKFIEKKDHQKYKTNDSMWKILKSMNKYVIITIFLYTSISFIILCFDEVFGIWALRKPNEGGINFSTFQIGISHAFSSICMLILQLFIFVPLERKLGLKKIFILSMIVWIPSLSMMPFSNSLYYISPYLMWTFLLICIGLKSSMGTTAMAVINLMINNAAGQKAIGSVNGLASSMAAFSRLIAPTFGGTIFAWSANSDLYFPLDFHFLFILLSMISLMNLFIALKLPESINKRNQHN